MFKEMVSDILVFKTDIDTLSSVERIGKVLGHNESVVQWNIDAQDVDHVLRIQCIDGLSPLAIINILHSAGFECEELPD